MFEFNMDKKFNPSKIEEKWKNLWIENKVFHADENSSKPKFSMVIPPPNVTGILHMGHALNNTIQDIIARYKRMNGYEVLWMPGTDHAGIATQNVVEKKLAKEGKTRQDLGREKFIEEVWKWKEKHGSYIIEQLKTLGASCDWDRERFTMDEGLSNAVKEVFVRLYEKGLIYRGKYIINWCPRCGTALADEEVEYEEEKGHLWYIKYPLKEDSSKYIVVATTRPETMLGDVAVAVNPKDERYKDFIGKTLILPLVGREIPVIADEMVDMEFGTGAVKITPAHDPNDYWVGERHSLEKINIFTPEAKINENAPEKYRGLDRYEARKKVIEDLEKEGYLIKVEEHIHSVGHCYRCHTVIEPYLSDQWFVKMKPLAEPAIKAVEEGDIRFIPERWTKVYLNWMYNIRDWCISRQIWWGHRIPVYTCKDCGHQMVSKNNVEVCEKCGSKNIEQDPDVLDTWFSSWLWPFSTMGWPENTLTLRRFYPTDVLVTGQDIIFFWVARMIMAGFEFTGRKPFTDIYIHGIVRDDQGRKMSKSLGNAIDPLDIIKEYGADALRFSLILITATGQDVYLSKEKFQTGRNFANKLWNATRFVMMKKDDFKYSGKKGEISNLIDKEAYSILNNVIKKVTDGLENYRFNEVAQELYEYSWHYFCDWYLEYKKIDLEEADDKEKENIFRNIFFMLENIYKMLHPYMPFITEELYEIIYEGNKKKEFLEIEEWPKYDEGYINSDVEYKGMILRNIISAIRNLRSENNIEQKRKVNVVVIAENDEINSMLIENVKYIKKLANVEEMEITTEKKDIKNAAVKVVYKNEVFLLLEGIVDIEEEKKKLLKELERYEKLLKSSQAKLSNKNFLEKAPQEVVEREKNKVENFKKQIELIKENLNKLG